MKDCGSKLLMLHFFNARNGGIGVDPWVNLSKNERSDRVY